MSKRNLIHILFEKILKLRYWLKPAFSRFCVGLQHKVSGKLTHHRRERKRRKQSRLLPKTALTIRLEGHQVSLGVQRNIPHIKAPIDSGIEDLIIQSTFESHHTTSSPLRPLMRLRKGSVPDEGASYDVVCQVELGVPNMRMGDHILTVNNYVISSQVRQGAFMASTLSKVAFFLLDMDI